jgi:hypothetical protein
MEAIPVKPSFTLLVGALVPSALVHAAELNVAVTSGGQAVIAADPGAVVSYEVTGAPTETADEGLSHFILDQSLEPGGQVRPIVQPRGMMSFSSIGHAPGLLPADTLTAPPTGGLYTLKAMNVLGCLIAEEDDRSEEIWATTWAFAGEASALTIALGRWCLDVASCADVDANGIRDGPCTGVQFGDCIPDSTADNNDKSHALNCCSNQNTTGSSAYPCEPSPPATFNVDARGPLRDCARDRRCRCRLAARLNHVGHSVHQSEGIQS